MAAINDFISMLDRSYEQNRANIPGRISQYIPEVTNHSETEALIKALNVWYGLVEMLGYNLDVGVRELFVPNAKLYKSLVGHAEVFDYRVRGRNPATVDLRFYLNKVATSIVTIPTGTECQTSDGTKYFTTEEGTINIGQIDVTVGAIQQEDQTNSNIGTTTGNANQSIVLDIEKIVDKSLQLTINAVVWNPVDTLAYASPTDKSFVQSINKDLKTKIQFGDDKTGDIPPSSFTISATYKTTEGAAGNVAPLLINTINDVISLDPGFTIDVQNVNAASGGTDEESIDTIRRNLTLHLRTLERAVTEQDYSDIAELAAGVAKAGTKYDCGKVIEVYIAPDGGGIASSGLLASTQTYVDARKMITTFVTVLAAGEVNILLVANVKAKSNYVNADVAQAVKDSLTTEYNNTNQDVGGTVYLSDIYEKIENTEGVSNSDIIKLSSIPFARTLAGSNTLLWTREVLEDSTDTIQWKIVFTTATDYQLFRDGTLVGNFSVTDTISLPEIEFTVNTSSYVLGDKFEFYTYPYNTNIDLVEMSIPIFIDANISLNVTGGI